MQQVQLGPLELLSSVTSFASMQVRDSLTARAKEFNILVDDIAITHLSFGTEVKVPCSQNACCGISLAYTLQIAALSLYYDSLNSNTAEPELLLLPLQFTKAVEAKQVAQQDAERARFVVLKADQVHFSACCSCVLSITCPGLLCTGMLFCSSSPPCKASMMVLAGDITPV